MTTLDLATYTPMGDKKNSDFFEEYLPRVYERREQSGLNQIVGNMAAVVVQVEHGDAINYLAELAVMGPYRYQAARLTDTHKVYVLQSQPEFPRLIVLEPLTATYEDAITRWNTAVPAGPQEAERPLHRRGLQGAVDEGGPRGARAAERPVRLPRRHGQQLLRALAPHVHVPVGLHLQPGRLRRRRHRRPRRAGAGGVGQPDRGRAGHARAGGRAAGRARHQGPDPRHRPRGDPDPVRRPGVRAARVPHDGARTTSGAPTTSTR